MTKLFECKAEDLVINSVEEEDTKLCFSHGCSDTSQNGALGDNCAIEINLAVLLGEGSEEEVTSCVSVGLGGDEVCHVTVDVEDRFACGIATGHLWMGYHVVCELVDLFHCFFSVGFLCYFVIPLKLHNIVISTALP